MKEIELKDEIILTVKKAINDFSDIDVDLIKLSSETVELNADSLPFDIPSNVNKLKAFCRSVAMLREHCKESVISNIRVCQERVLPQRYDAYSVHKFAEYLQEYAKACEETGYDGISTMDIEEKMQEFLK